MRCRLYMQRGGVLYLTCLRNAFLQGELRSANSNAYLEAPLYHRIGKTLEMQLRGKHCFDFKYYRQMAPDLKDFSEKDMWSDFVHTEQFQGRQFRYACEATVPYITAICQVSESWWMRNSLSITEDSVALLCFISMASYVNVTCIPYLPPCLIDTLG